MGQKALRRIVRRFLDLFLEVFGNVDVLLLQPLLKIREIFFFVYGLLPRFLAAREIRRF